MNNRKVNFTLNGQRVAIEVRISEEQPQPGKRDIDLNPVTVPYKTLSIVGELAGSIGQCVDTLREMNEEECNEDIERLCDIWDAYHLNDIKAGTRQQMAITKGSQSFDGAVNRLKINGLVLDRGYEYGSKWLVELLDDEDLEELSGILDRLNGQDIGEAPDLDMLPEIEGSDMIDSRDLIERLEGYRAWAKALGFDPDTVDRDSVELTNEQYAAGVMLNIEELQALREFASQCESYAPDFNFGETIIADDYFQTYAEELAEDIGAVNNDAKWPNNHIDWESAADELKIDYTAVEFKGETYWIR